MTKKKGSSLSRRRKFLYDQILVIDVESTCWDGEISIRPTSAESEIIEVGIALLDHHTGVITREDSLLIRPVRSEVSEFCTQLTGWTQEDLMDGLTYEEACKTLRKDYSSRRRIFASWGNYDRNQFMSQSRSFDVDYPFGPSHLNVKDLFIIQSRIWSQCDVMTALQMLGLEFEGRWHNGGDDAYNIARILACLLGVGEVSVSVLQ